MKRSGAVVKMTVFLFGMVLVTTSAGGLYYYTLPASALGQPSSYNVPSQGPGNINEQGSKFLGYIPAGYQVAPRNPNAPHYNCPSDMNSTNCAQFEQSCGNGVCDPNESCATCPIDCGVPQGLACDPYTGRASGVGAVCEIYVPTSNTQAYGGNPNNYATPGSNGGG